MTSVGPLLVTFFFYFIVMLFVGLKAYRNTVNLDDYILGGRKLHLRSQLIQANYQPGVDSSLPSNQESTRVISRK